MLDTIYLDRDAKQWVLPNGRRIPVISGGATDDENAPIVVPEGTPEVPPAEQAPTSKSEQRFTAEDIERARREEKEKLYPKLDTLTQKLTLFEQEAEEARRLRTEEQQRQNEERKQLEERELIEANKFEELLTRRDQEWEQRFNETQTQWQDRLAAIEEERNAHAALLDKERQFQQVESYKTRRIQEEADNLAPQLLHFVVGDTPEQIDAAISSVAAATSAIVNDIQQSSRQLQRPIPATGQAPSTSPTENTMGQKTYSMDDLKNMDMSTYAAEREKLLAAVSRR